MKKLKTILCSLLMVCLVVPACLMLSACGNSNTVSSDRTMSLSINPEISFVVDKDNKIAAFLMKEVKMPAQFMQMLVLRV